MKVENEYEAKALYLFLSLERGRHQKDIEKIDRDLRNLQETWDLFFETENKNLWTDKYKLVELNCDHKKHVSP